MRRRSTANGKCDTLSPQSIAISSENNDHSKNCNDNVGRAVSMKNIRRMNHAVDEEDLRKMQEISMFQSQGQNILIMFSFLALVIFIVFAICIYFWMQRKHTSNHSQVQGRLVKLAHHLIKTSRTRQNYVFMNHSWIPKNFDPNTNAIKNNVRKIISLYPTTITRNMLDSIEYTKNNPQLFDMFSIFSSIIWFMAPSGTGYLIPKSHDIHGNNSNNSNNNNENVYLRPFLQRMVKVHKHVIKLQSDHENDDTKQIIFEYHDKESLRSYVSQHGQSCYPLSSQERGKKSTILDSLRKQNIIMSGRNKNYRPLSWETNDLNEKDEIEIEFNLWCMIHTGYAQGFINLSEIDFPETTGHSLSPFQMSNQNWITNDIFWTQKNEPLFEKENHSPRRTLQLLPSVLLLKDNYNTGFLTRDILDVILAEKQIQDEDNTGRSVAWKAMEETIANIIHDSNKQNGNGKWNSMDPICENEMKMIDYDGELMASVKFCPMLKEADSCCGIFFKKN